MRTIKTILSFFFCLFIGQSSFAHQVLSDWELGKESDQIEISYRYLSIGDTLKTREMRISFYVDASPNRLIPMFKDAEHLKAWSARTERCEIIQSDSNTWTTYCLFNIPWPFQKKDLITEYHLTKTDSSIIISMEGKPDQVPYFKDILRMEKYEGEWSFVPLKNGKTKVELTTISFTKSNIPKYIRDPIIQSVFIDSINNLKELISHQHCQRIVAFE